MSKSDLKFNDFLEVSLMEDVFKTSNESTFNNLIKNQIRCHESTTLCLANYNLNSLSISLSNKEFQEYYDEVEFAWIDGMPIIFMLKALGYKVPTNWRLTFLDWQHSFFPMANEKQWSVFILGATEESNDSFLNIMKQRYPDIKFNGHHGFFKDNDQIISEINSHSPDILLVGMGMPKQEIWIKNNKKELNTKLIMPLGGYFDYIAGNTYTPPRLAGKLGLEWLFRLVANPRRLAFRYLVEPWPVVFNFLKYLHKKA